MKAKLDSENAIVTLNESHFNMYQMLPCMSEIFAMVTG
jgi:hypothetical protein